MTKRNEEKKKPAKSAKTGEPVKMTETGETAEPRAEHLPPDLFWRACPGPLSDGSCRTPEETCNNPNCPARG